MDVLRITAVTSLGFLGIFAFPIAVGLISGVTHCAGMCGPIHFFLAQRGNRKGLWFYHLGRIITYSALGASLALAGLGWQHTVGNRSVGWIWVSLYILMGLKLFGVPIWPAAWEAGFSRWIIGRIKPLNTHKAGGAGWFFPLGITAGFLPCATTQAGLAWSVGTGNVVSGGLGMLLLGASTLPLFALIPRRFLIGKSGRFHQALGVALFAFAAWKIYGLIFANTVSCH